MEMSKFKTKPLKHQAVCLQRHGRKPGFALLAEQGTGKTWIIINNIADLWSSGDLDGVIVLAPNGVHTNWIEIELKKHMPDWVRWRGAEWVASPNKAQKRALEQLNYAEPGELRILSMNWEALQHKRSQEFAEKFANSCCRLMVVGDEFSAVKNPDAIRTKFLMKNLRKHSCWRRVMDGTPVNNSPFDMFTPFTFLDETILGTTSYYSFKAEYAEMLPPTNPLVQSIMEKSRTRFVPQVVAKGANNKPKYRNLDKLSALIDPYSFRVLKKDCLDLPEKIYKTGVVDMTKEQWDVYKKAREEYRLQFGNKETAFNQLTIETKLSQITSGYYLHPLCGDGDEPVRIPGKNPKLEFLMERVEACVGAGEKVIVWARYRVQIQDICAALAERGISFVEYHGGVSKKERSPAIEAYENGDAQVFVANQAAGGTGITLVATSTVFYFSQDFSLRNRLQSEDRAHRIGQKKNVVYWDIIARGTTDEKIIRALQNKEDLADTITNKGLSIYVA